MVNVNSKFAVDYFKKLRELADPQDGSVLIPGDQFYRWRPNKYGETLPLANEDLVLFHSDWVLKPSATGNDEEE